MKFEHYLQRLEKSDSFKKFKRENPDSYLSAGFFVVDFSVSKKTHNLDFYIPKKNKIAVFDLEDNKMQLSNGAVDKIPKKLAGEVRIDIDAIPGIAEDEMKNHTVTDKLSKIIAILQILDGKKTWVLKCITQGLGILTIHLDDESESVLFFEKASIFDFVKKA